MARRKRVRLSEHEVELIDQVSDEMFGDASDDVPRGKVIANLAEEYLSDQGGGDD